MIYNFNEVNLFRGGNLATGVVMKCLEHKFQVPNGLLLIYPCLSFDMACWMPKHHVNLIRAESTKSLSTLITAKQITTDSPLAVPEAPRWIDVLRNKVDRSKSWYQALDLRRRSGSVKKRESMSSSLSMTSRMSYFNDRILTPESTISSFYCF